MKKTVIKESNIHGAGMFASTCIAKGQTIQMLDGEVVSFREIVRRIQAGTTVPDDPLQIGENLYMDLDHSAHAINHSCDPNAGVRYQNELVAIKDIMPGEEISYDYSTTVSTSVSLEDWSMRCRCGAANCRSLIGSIATIPVKQIQMYRNANALQDYILVELGAPSSQNP